MNLRPLLSIAACAALLLLSACASYSGSSLVAGKSTASDVEQLMGPPAEKIGEPSGDSVWFYPRGPYGRHTYAVRVAPDGVVRSVEQRLTMENLSKLVAGETAAKDVRALFGPPSRAFRSDRQQRDIWEYPMKNQVDVDHTLIVQFSYDGIVREAMLLRDPKYDAGSWAP
jgi:outer membrane protein assembly factor BamE (lipoprotein component of BamABCDE complex)